MRNTTRQTRENRTITVDFHDEATYVQLLGNGKAFVELVIAFVLALGLQLRHKATCRGGGCLTRHSHYVRVQLGGIPIWRLQGTTCRAVFTVLPHFILRYRQMRPDMARDALLATHGGLSLELCAVICHISPMALYRLVGHSMSCFFWYPSYNGSVFSTGCAVASAREHSLDITTPSPAPLPARRERLCGDRGPEWRQGATVGHEARPGAKTVAQRAPTPV
jgi:hypothetical protein